MDRQTIPIGMRGAKASEGELRGSAASTCPSVTGKDRRSWESDISVGSQKGVGTKAILRGEKQAFDQTVRERIPRAGAGALSGDQTGSRLVRDSCGSGPYPTNKENPVRNFNMDHHAQTCIKTCFQQGKMSGELHSWATWENAALQQLFWLLILGP